MYGVTRGYKGGLQPESLADGNWLTPMLAETIFFSIPRHRVGQNRIYTPYMTVYMVISLPKIPCIHRIYFQMYGSGQS